MSIETRHVDIGFIQQGIRRGVQSDPFSGISDLFDLPLYVYRLEDGLRRKFRKRWDGEAVGWRYGSACSSGERKARVKVVHSTGMDTAHGHVFTKDTVRFFSQAILETGES